MTRDDYELFCEKVNSDSTAYDYDGARHGQQVLGFQLYGLSAKQVECFWERYKRQRTREYKTYGHTRKKWYRFSCSQACLLRA